LECEGTAKSGNTLDIDVVIRDFKDTHADFEAYLGSDPGIVKTALGVDGKPVYESANSNPTVTSAATFDQWYRDVPSVNSSTTKTLTLDNGMAGDGGIYSYTNSAFFPIDGELFGNEDRGHNYHFTLEMHTDFTCVAGQTFSFTGDDDLWVFIDGSLTTSPVPAPSSLAILGAGLLGLGLYRRKKLA